MLTISKSYSGSANRTLEPDTNTFAGLSGDDNSTVIKFKFPSMYDDYVKNVRFNFYLKDESGNKYFPTYNLDSNNSMTIPLAVTAVGGGVSFTLIFSNTDGTFVEESRPSMIYFDGPKYLGTYDLTDDFTVLSHEVFINAVYSLNTSSDRPSIVFTNPLGGTVTTVLDVPYLGTDNTIPDKFLPSDLRGSIWSVTDVSELTSLTSALEMDLAIVTPVSGLGTLYVLTAEDPTVADNWYKVKPNTKAEVGLGNVDNTSDADKPISTAMQTALDSLQSSLTAEITARTNADTVLQNNIDSEAGTRASADTALQTDVDAKLDTSVAASTYQTLANLVTAFQSVPDDTHYASEKLVYDSLALKATSEALASEVSSRESADSALQTAIDSEASVRSSADTALQSNIDEKLSITDASATYQILANLVTAFQSTPDDSHYASEKLVHDQLALKASASSLSAHIADTDNPHSVTKTQVGLGNCDNTSDADKPISTATQTALDAKQATMHAGSGISFSGTTINHSNSITAGSHGSATSIPSITYDAQGHITLASGITVYPPTDAGTANQYWMSNGTGVGSWHSADTSPTESSGYLVTSGGIYSELALKATVSALTAESIARTSADTALQNNIDSEASSRNSADSDLQSAIDTKVTANTSITAGTAAKITYDSKGLIISGTSLSASDVPTIAQSQVSGLVTALAGKVDTESGYSLMSDAEHTKLSEIAAGAEVNVQSDWSVSDTASDAYILNKPTLGTAASKDVGTAEGDVPILGSDGKLPTTVVPSISITEYEGTVTAYDDLATLSSAEQGDYAIVNDTVDDTDNGTYFLNGTYSTLTDWILISSSATSVTSVNGYIGVVNLAASDVHALADTVKYAYSMSVSGTSVTLKDQDGTALSTITTQDTTYDVATVSADGLMSSTDKTNLDTFVSGLVTAFQSTPDDTHYPSEKLVYDQLALKLTANTAITPATSTKITYDANGLVTAGTSLSASDIPDIAESQVTNLVSDLASKLASSTASTTYQTLANLVTAFQDTPDDTHYASEKLVYDQLALKASSSVVSSHIANTSNPHSVTKTQVGLGNCDNTADADKPVSTATQTALDAKQATVTAGTGLAFDGATLNHSNSITAGSQGSATSIPVITYDAEGHISSAGASTVYPPTEAGTANQYWRSQGSGVGVWQTADSVPTESSTKLAVSGGIYTAIADEASARSSADTSLQMNIDAKLSTATAVSTYQTLANLVTAFQTTPDDTHYISEKLAYDQLALKADALSTTAGTYTKLAVNSQGLISSGSTLSASDVPDIAESQVTGLTADLDAKQDVLTAGGNIDITDNVISAEISDLPSGIEQSFYLASSTTLSPTKPASDVSADVSLVGTTATQTDFTYTAELDSTFDSTTSVYCSVRFSGLTAGILYAWRPLLNATVGSTTTLLAEVALANAINFTPSGTTYTAYVKMPYVPSSSFDAPVGTVFTGSIRLVKQSGTDTVTVHIATDIVNGNYVYFQRSGGFISATQVYDVLDSTVYEQSTLNALDATHRANTSNPHSVTKTQIGLGNCDNTSDADKPISTATQTALDAKQATVTGGATTVVSDDLSASKALVSNASGKIAVSAVTATELGYVAGVTSALQTQLDAKQATVTGAATTVTLSDLSVSLALVSNASGKIAVSAVSSTELGYLSGVTSALQTQLDAKAITSHASSASTYGLGTTSLYGHVKIVEALTTSEATDGLALGAYQGKLLSDAIALKQDALTFDTTPIASSTNPVTSGGIKTALDAKQSTLTFDSTPTSASTNPVTSGGVYTSVTAVQTTANAALPKSGGTMTGALVNASGTLTTAQSRNITISTSDPSGGSSGDVWLVYTE